MKSMTANDTLPASTRGRATNILLWTLQILLAAAFVFGGVNKLVGIQPEVIESFARMGFGDWFRYFVGVLELAGGLGLLIPRLSGLAALGLAGVMLGAVLLHLFIFPPRYYATIPAVLVTVFALIAWGRRVETRSILKTLARSPS